MVQSVTGGEPSGANVHLGLAIEEARAAEPEYNDSGLSTGDDNLGTINPGTHLD